MGQFDVCHVVLDVSKVGLLGLGLDRPSFFLPLQGKGEEEGRRREGRGRGGEGGEGKGEWEGEGRGRQRGRERKEQQDEQFITFILTSVTTSLFIVQPARAHFTTCR